MPSAKLIQNYHTVSCTGAVLLKPWEEGDLWEDYFEEGGEPRLSRQALIRAPNCAGNANGELYHDGNTRYQATIRRVVHFCPETHSWPYTLTEDVAGLGNEGAEFDDAFEMAQKWLVRHVKNLSDSKGTLTWNGEAFSSAILDVSDATTDGAFAYITYNITASEAA